MRAREVEGALCHRNVAGSKGDPEASGRFQMGRRLPPPRECPPSEATCSGSERAHCRKRAVPAPGAGASRRVQGGAV